MDIINQPHFTEPAVNMCALLEEDMKLVDS